MKVSFLTSLGHSATRRTDSIIDPPVHATSVPSGSDAITGYVPASSVTDSLVKRAGLLYSTVALAITTRLTRTKSYTVPCIALVPLLVTTLM